MPLKTDWRAYFQGRYLSAPQLEHDTTVTIARVSADLVEDPDNRDEKEEKLIVYFREKVKPWVTNVTTCMCIEALYGADPNGWTGKPLTLFNDKSVRAFGKVGGIRVRGAPGIGRTKRVTIKLPGKKAYKVDLVDTMPRQSKPTRSLADVMADNDLTVADCERWLTATERPLRSPDDDEQRSGLAAWLQNEPALINEIRALIPQE